MNRFELYQFLTKENKNIPKTPTRREFLGLPEICSLKSLDIPSCLPSVSFYCRRSYSTQPIQYPRGQSLSNEIADISKLRKPV